MPGSEASTSAEQNFPQTRNEDGNKTVDNLKTGDDADDDEPKPEENVDFFIDDVERQDAETVEFLHSSGGTEFVEGAFGNFGEHSGHGIVPQFRLQFSHTQNIAAVACEFASEEEIHEEYLSEDVDKVEKFTEEKSQGVEIVVAFVVDKVVDEKADSVILGVAIDDGHIHVLNQHLDLSRFPYLPQVSRDVEKNRLEEEGEADPLVVLVILEFLPFGQLPGGSHAGVSKVLQSAAVLGDGERGVDPAVGVHDLLRNLLDDAVDGVADVLFGGDEQRARDEDDEGGLVVKPEDVVVDAYRVELDDALDGAENVKHFGGGFSSVTSTSL